MVHLYTLQIASAQHLPPTIEEGMAERKREKEGGSEGGRDEEREGEGGRERENSVCRKRDGVMF